MLKRYNKFNTTKETIKIWRPLLQILYVQWKANCLQLLLIREVWVNAIAEHKMREYNKKKIINHSQNLNSKSQWMTFNKPLQRNETLSQWISKVQKSTKASPLGPLGSPVYAHCFTELVAAVETVFPWLWSVSEVFTCPAVEVHLWSHVLCCRVRNLKSLCRRKVLVSSAYGQNS